jgi:Protein of unknown function (DUF3592)
MGIGVKARVFAVMFAAFGAGLLIWLAVDVVGDVQLGRRGVVVTATVQDIRGNDKNHDCLATFVIEGVTYTQWAHKIGRCRIGDRTAIIVDPHDRSSLQSTHIYHDRWYLYAVMGVGGLIAVWLAVSVYGNVRRHEQYLAE